MGTPPHPDELQSNKDSASPRSNASPPSAQMGQLDLNLQHQDKDRTSGGASGGDVAGARGGVDTKTGPTRPGGHTTPSPTGSVGSNGRHSGKGSPDGQGGQRSPDLGAPGWSEDAAAAGRPDGAAAAAVPPGRPNGAEGGASGGAEGAGAAAAGGGRLLPSVGPEIDRWRETHQPSITTGGYWGRMYGRHPRKSKGKNYKTVYFPSTSYVFT